MRFVPVRLPRRWSLQFKACNDCVEYGIRIRNFQIGTILTAVDWSRCFLTRSTILVIFNTIRLRHPLQMSMPVSMMTCMRPLETCFGRHLLIVHFGWSAWTSPKDTGDTDTGNKPVYTGLTLCTFPGTCDMGETTRVHRMVVLVKYKIMVLDIEILENCYLWKECSPSRFSWDVWKMFPYTPSVS